MRLEEKEEFTKDLKIGDHIYYAEYDSSEPDELKIKDLKIKEIYAKTGHIEGVASDAFLCDLVDERFPKTTIRKTDISRGYYKTKKEAVEVFVEEFEKIYQACKNTLAKL
jgi:hypothetical protein